MKPLSYGKQLIDAQDIKSVLAVLKSDFLSSGPKVPEFEKQIAAYCGAKYAVAVSSGTAALHLAALAAGLGPGDEAITTPITFLASANCIVYTGAKPVFADIDYHSINIDPLQIAKVITPKTKAIIPVHFAGLPVDLGPIYKTAKKNKIAVIEDACHALGAVFGGQKIGACRFSDMTAFSFHPVKHITTGEGGCITTNNPKYYEKLLRLRNHGWNQTVEKREQHGDWYREMVDLGFNYRITDMQCALGISQLQKLDLFLERRREIAAFYDAAFAELDPWVMRPTFLHPNKKHAWHLYVLRVRPGTPGFTRRSFFDALKQEGILPQVHYVPLHYQPFYKNLLKGNKRFPNAEKYYEEALSLPMYPALKDAEVRKVVKMVHKIVKKAVHIPYVKSKATVSC